MFVRLLFACSFVFFFIYFASLFIGIHIIQRNHCYNFSYAILNLFIFFLLYFFMFLRYISGIRKVYYIRYDDLFVNLSVPFSFYVLGAQFSIHHFAVLLFVGFSFYFLFFSYIQQSIVALIADRILLYAIFINCFAAFLSLATDGMEKKVAWKELIRLKE